MGSNPIWDSDIFPSLHFSLHSISLLLFQSYDHFHNSAYDSAAWKNNEKTTVQAQQSEQAVKILQHSRLQAAAGKSARAPPDKEEEKVTSGEIEPTKG